MHTPPAVPLFLRADEGERFTIIGGGVRILTDGASSGGQCCMFEAPVPPGEGPPRHSHQREDELFYVLDGRFRFLVDGREFVGEKGTFALAPRGSIHAFKNIGTGTGLLLVTCTPAGIEAPFRAIRMPDQPGSPGPTMEQIALTLGRHGITIHGPPLE